MSRVKNLFTTLLIDWIIGIHMQQSALKDVLVVIGIMSIAVYCLLEEMDRTKFIVLQSYGFRKYKTWFMSRLNEKRLKGYDKKRLEKMALSIIMHQKKYAFSGGQIEELLELAKDDYVTNCVQCGKPIPKKDALVTVVGEICENCLEVS